MFPLSLGLISAEEFPLLKSGAYFKASSIKNGWHSVVTSALKGKEGSARKLGKDVSQKSIPSPEPLSLFYKANPCLKGV